MDKFKEKLLKTLQLCNMELENRKKGIVGESTEEQLEEIIIPELKTEYSAWNTRSISWSELWTASDTDHKEQQIPSIEAYRQVEGRAGVCFGIVVNL